MEVIESEVAILGGGVIGLSIGWQLQRRGIRCVVIDQYVEPKGASWVAAGMLAPQAEVGFEELPFLRLGEESLRLYPQFVQELVEDSGIAPDFEASGTLMIALDRDDSAFLKRLYDFRKEIGLPVKWISGSEARDLEPLLSPKIPSAIWFKHEGQIDPRLLFKALNTAFSRREGHHIQGEITHFSPKSEASSHTIFLNGLHGPLQVKSPYAVLALGAWSNTIEGIELPLRPPVRPIKGQVISLQMTTHYTLSKVIRSPRTYFAPKASGRLVVGATSEEYGFDTTPTAGGAYTLLEEAYQAIPSTFEMPFLSHDVGLRPGSRDHEPIIGASAVLDLWYATGHYRHGILLTPVTAFAIAAEIQHRLTGVQADLLIAESLLTPFLPARFHVK